MATTLYRISFLHHGKVIELYARSVTSTDLYGFVSVAELVLDLGESLVVDPTEERLRDEFGDTDVLHLPLHTVLRVESVRRRKQSRIRDASTGETVVTPFPLAPLRRRGDE